MTKLSLFLIVLSMFFFANIFPQSIYPADSKQVDYVGRVERLGDGSVMFDWVGVYFRTRFTGDYCAVNVSDSKSSFYYLFIDGEFHKDINTRGNDTIIELCRGIGGGMHELMLFKRTEGNEGMTTFKQIIIGNNERLFSVINKPKRRIEFIGNSITCGFGTDTNDPQEEYSAQTENAYYSYASLTARNFGADYTLIAHSGEGVVRNYGDSKRISDYTMRDRFYTLHDNRKDKKWGFDFKPDVVVVNLGTNDFSQLLQPTPSEFQSGYVDLLKSIRKVYGNIPILALSSPMSNDVHRKCIEDVCKSQKDNDLYFIPMHKYLLNSKTDMGVSYHPNRIGQQKLAMLLTAYMSSIMGWELEDIE